MINLIIEMKKIVFLEILITIQVVNNRLLIQITMEIYKAKLNWPLNK